ncbi:hypothetical protein OO9_06317 [Providencia alcalifaciens Dmel2]|nr:hypothetical protein OO9_06317 [Providencia alcalifaciens Dmel2]
MHIHHIAILFLVLQNDQKKVIGSNKACESNIYEIMKGHLIFGYSFINPQPTYSNKLLIAKSIR